MSKKSQQSQDQYVLRLPDGMRDRLKKAAAANNRTMNFEIIDRLEYSFSAWPRLSLPDEFQERAMAALPQFRVAYEANLFREALEMFETHFPKPGYYRDRIRETVDDYFDQLPDTDREEQRARLSEYLERIFKEHGAEETRDGYGLRNIQRRFGEAASEGHQPPLPGFEDDEK